MKSNGYVATISLLKYPEALAYAEKRREYWSSNGGFWYAYLNNDKKTVRCWVRTIHTDECQKSNLSSTMGRSDREDLESHGLDKPWFEPTHAPNWSLLRGCKLCGTDRGVILGAS